jgi:hypothetical protein
MLDKYDYILAEATNYKTQHISLADNWEWSMYEHVRRSFLYKHSKFSEGENDGDRPNKNIVRPILNVAYRSEGFDVKDIEPFVDSEADYYKSFLVRKYHPKWARNNDIDTFIDEMVESYVDYGLALIKNVGNVAPKVTKLQDLAFCDQTDILSGAICELHNMTPSEMMEMKAWDSEQVENAIVMAEAEKTNTQVEGKKNKTPSKYIEVYELHGTFPAYWLKDEVGEEYIPQVHYVCYYEDKKGKKHGITLFSAKEPKPRYKALKRDDVYGRACGWGGVEELFDPQMWTNYNQIQLKEMLDASALMLLKTSNKAFAEENANLEDMEKGQVVYMEEGQDISQVIFQPINKQLFEDSVTQWEQHARTMGSADEPLLGTRAPSGSPFALEALTVQESKGLHNYRQGKVATFLGEVYRDWSLQFLVNDMNKGQKFFEELSAEEMQEVADAMVNNQVNERLKGKIMNFEVPTEADKALFEEVVRADFAKAGKKRFMEIVEGELKDLPIDVEMNIAGKQKDLADMAQKLTQIFRTVIASPQVLQDPNMAQLFNEILESSGFSPLSYSGLTKGQPVQSDPTQQPEQVQQDQPIN